MTTDADGSGDAPTVHEIDVVAVYHEHASLAEASCSCGWRSGRMDDGDARDAAWMHELEEERRLRPFTHDVQNDIAEFHRAVVGIEDSRTPGIRRPELRAELIREEAQETVDAILRGDLLEAIDGMCDILAVVYGTAAEFGIDLAPFWDEVHRTNMAKAGGPVREDGKRLKPPGWTPPDIAGVLARVAEDSPRV